MSAANKAAVRAYVDAFNAHDVARLTRLFAPDAKIWGVPGAGSLEMAMGIWRELHEGMEMRLEILDLVAEGDSVAVRLRETGRFAGPFRGLGGLAPTGRPYEVAAMEWFRLEDGKITERWGARDSAAILRQVSEA